MLIKPLTNVFEANKSTNAVQLQGFVLVTFAFPGTMGRNPIVGLKVMHDREKSFTAKLMEGCRDGWVTAFATESLSPRAHAIQGRLNRFFNLMPLTRLFHSSAKLRIGQEQNS